MTEDNKNTNGDVQFPLNHALLEESTRIKEERKVIKARIEKIESTKEQVSETVYQKVKSDYTDQLNENTNKLLEKKQDIDRELATLYDAKNKLEVNVASHQEALEEINFRQSLGEYKKEEFHKLSDEQNEKLGKFKKILAAIETNVGKYEALFEDEDGLFSETVQEAPPPPPPPAEPQTEAPVSVEEEPEEYHVSGSEGYFGQVTEDVPLSGKTPMPEKTDKEIEEPAGAPAEAPKLVIVEGDNKGQEFVVPEEEVTIGRASSNFVVLKEAKVSRQHASIKKHGNEYLLEDLRSSNGVFVNDEKVQEHALANGDIIKIGDFVLKFVV